MVEELDKLTVVKLKERLKELGLPVAGRKAELVARLQEALEAEGVSFEPYLVSFGKAFYIFVKVLFSIIQYDLWLF